MQEDSGRNDIVDQCIDHMYVNLNVNDKQGSTVKSRRAAAPPLPYGVAHDVTLIARTGAFLPPRALDAGPGPAYNSHPVSVIGVDLGPPLANYFNDRTKISSSVKSLGRSPKKSFLMQGQVGICFLTFFGIMVYRSEVTHSSIERCGAPAPPPAGSRISTNLLCTLTHMP
ncbi:hypothetical protein EVAR_22541_1 [Eumeta japonica]|uniref:Uncharacterized protein n=1 Tax=Eumeta variegata TaxID=151549 RepID=A0A4C1U7A9_EUMVA|nr:hypothetical protein EVAR_22541_1 [Eumeta japonica]